MKITNLEKGKDFQLEPNAQLEIERTNPFFNNYGEQSIPMDLPASPYNCQLLGYPEQFGHRGKSQPIDVHIQDGEYSSGCRMALLSAQRNASLSVSFYMNDGSFYSRIQDKRLKDIFGDEKVTGVSTVDQAIAFCRNLIDGNDNRFAIFPILVTDDSGMDNQNTYKAINGYGKVVSNQGFKFVPGSDSDFWGAVERNEYVDGKLIRLEKGYYISPFIRANYVLERVFSHFGYTLESNFFTDTSPFDNMVIVNNVIDTIVNGYIRLTDLLPDVSVGDFINLYRKKFCCEFVADEAKRSVSVMLFKDIISAAPVADLSKCLVGHPEFSFNQSGDFRRVVLKTDETVPSDLDDSYDNIGELKKAHNGIVIMRSTGAISKLGYAPGLITTQYTKIGEASMPYDTGEEDIEAEEISSPDCMPEFRVLYNVVVTDNYVQSYDNGVWLYVGDYRTLNSKVVLDAASTEETSEDAPKQHLMLAFTTTRPDGMPVGTVSAYYPSTGVDEYLFGAVPTYEYALHFYGEYGLYEKFWRDYDNLLRNALQQVKAKLLMSQSQKQNLPAHRTVAIDGKVFFFDKLRFALGGDTEPMESDLLTIDIEDPATYSPSPSEMFQKYGSEYRWNVVWYGEKITKDQYEKAEDKDRAIQVAYPPLPSAAYAGQQFGKQTTSHLNPYFSMLCDKNGNSIEWGVYVAETFYIECVAI